MPSSVTPEPEQAFNRQAKRKQRTRMKLIEAANQVFLQKGVDATNATDITEQADVAYATFYNHFKSIDEIVPFVVEQVLQDHDVRFREVRMLHTDPAMRVALGLRNLFSRVVADPAIKWLAQKPEVLASELYKVIADDAQEEIGAGIESGDFSLPCEFSVMRIYTIWGLTGALHQLSSDPSSLEHITQEITRIFLRVLGVSDTKLNKVVSECAAMAG